MIFSQNIELGQFLDFTIVYHHAKKQKRKQTSKQTKKDKKNCWVVIEGKKD